MSLALVGGIAGLIPHLGRPDVPLGAFPSLAPDPANHACFAQLSKMAFDGLCA